MATETGATPGSDIPREEAEIPHVDSKEVTGVDPSATGDTRIAKLPHRHVKVEKVVVNGDQSDYEFQIQLDDNSVFASAANPSETNADEEFFPDAAAKEQAGASAWLLEVEITTAGTAGSVNFMVEYRHS